MFNESVAEKSGTGCLHSVRLYGSLTVRVSRLTEKLMRPLPNLDEGEITTVLTSSYNFLLYKLVNVFNESITALAFHLSSLGANQNGVGPSIACPRNNVGELRLLPAGAPRIRQNVVANYQTSPYFAFRVVI